MPAVNGTSPPQARDVLPPRPIPAVAALASHAIPTALMVDLVAQLLDSVVSLCTFLHFNLNFSHHDRIYRCVLWHWLPISVRQMLWQISRSNRQRRWVDHRQYSNIRQKVNLEFRGTHLPPCRTCG
jgi:hypothetical protein